MAATVSPTTIKPQGTWQRLVKQVHIGYSVTHVLTTQQEQSVGQLLRLAGATEREAEAVRLRGFRFFTCRTIYLPMRRSGSIVETFSSFFASITNKRHVATHF